MRRARFRSGAGRGAERLVEALRVAGTEYDRACAAGFGAPLGVVLAPAIELDVACDAAVDDAGLAGAFGLAMGRELARAVAAGRAVHFADAAAFVASCAAAVLEPARCPWFARRYLRTTAGESLVALFAAHRDSLPRALATLHTSGHLPAVLAAMSVPGSWLVASAGLGCRVSHLELFATEASAMHDDDHDDSGHDGDRGFGPEGERPDPPDLAAAMRRWSERVEAVLQDAFAQLGADEGAGNGAKADDGAGAEPLADVGVVLDGLERLRAALRDAAKLGGSLDADLAELLQRPLDGDEAAVAGAHAADPFEGVPDWEGILRQALRSPAGDAPGQPESGRALFETAMRLAADLGAPMSTAVRTRAYRAWRRSSDAGATDWKDPRALSEAVAAALGHCLDARRGAAALRRLPASADGRAAVRRAVEGLDWLDRPTLERRVFELVDDAVATAGDEGTVSPRLQRLRQELASVIEAHDGELDSGVPASAANAIRVYAAFVAKHPELRADAGLGSAIRHALATWGRHGRRPAAPGLTDQLVTPCAGLFLLLRAVADLGLPTRLAAVVDGAAGQGATRRERWLAAIGLRYAGAAGVEGDGGLDPGLSCWCGAATAQRLDDLRQAFADAPPADAASLHASLLGHLRAALRADDDALLLRTVGDGPTARLLGIGAASGIPWFAGPPGSAAAPDEHLPEWGAIWRTATGEGAVFRRDDTGADTRFDALHADPAAIDTPNGAIGMLAAAVLSTWVRWLRGFDGSTAAFTLDQLVRRPGALHLGRERVTVVVRPKPLDVVLEQAGYFADLSGLPWLPRGGLRFRRSP